MMIGPDPQHIAFASAPQRLLDVADTINRVRCNPGANAKRLGPALEAYLKQLKPRHDQASVRNKSLLMTRLTPFLRGKSFEDVSTALLSEVTTELTKLSSKDRLSPNTIRRINSDLKHFLNWCVEEGHLAAVPRFPKIAGDQARRTHFNDADWRRLARYLREFVKVENKAVRRDRTILVNYVLILANTGIRVGEARTLKWQHIPWFTLDGAPLKSGAGQRLGQGAVLRDRDRSCIGVV